MANSNSIRAGQAYVEASLDESKLRSGLNAARATLGKWASSVASTTRNALDGITARVNGMRTLVAGGVGAAIGRKFGGQMAGAQDTVRAQFQALVDGMLEPVFQKMTEFITANKETIGKLLNLRGMADVAFAGLEFGWQKFKLLVMQGLAEIKRGIMDFAITMLKSFNFVPGVKDSVSKLQKERDAIGGDNATKVQEERVNLAQKNLKKVWDNVKAVDWMPKIDDVVTSVKRFSVQGTFSAAAAGAIGGPKVLDKIAANGARQVQILNIIARKQQGIGVN